ESSMRALLRLTTEPPDSGGSDRPLDFHRRLPGYQETPLVEAPRLAERLGVARVFVKDETSRFGLPSFKILGASWATYAALRERLGPMPDGSLSHEGLQSWATPARPLTLLAATDGNHGRAVARVAKWLGLKARIFVPNFVAPGRLRAIEDEGAELVVIDGVYDASVDAALEASRGADTPLISDTALSVSDAVPRMGTAGCPTALRRDRAGACECGGRARRRGWGAGRCWRTGMGRGELGEVRQARPFPARGRGRAGSRGLRHGGPRRRRADRGLGQGGHRHERPPMR